jgi:hypothetical protein
MLGLLLPVESVLVMAARLLLLVEAPSSVNLKLKIVISFDQENIFLKHKIDENDLR